MSAVIAQNRFFNFIN